MDFKEIQELIKLINKSNLTEFKMKDGDFQLSIRTKKYGKGKPQLIQPQQQIVPIQTGSIPSVQIPPVQAKAPKAEASSGDNDKEIQEVDQLPESDKLIDIKSPIVGTFYRAPSPDKPPYLKVGDTVNVGDVVCIVEAMKLFNEIESEVSGKVVKVVIDDASPVEYDQILFKIDPNG